MKIGHELEVELLVFPLNYLFEPFSTPQCREMFDAKIINTSIAPTLAPIIKAMFVFFVGAGSIKFGFP